MSKSLFPTLVIGAGAWGTALAIALARNGHDVLLWGRDAQHMAAMKQSLTNERYLPGLALPQSIKLVDELDAAITVANHILISVPSHAFVAILKSVKDNIQPNVPVSWATKGLTPLTGEFLYDTVEQTLEKSHPLAIISGPSFAKEVAQGLPTAFTVAARDSVFADDLATALHSPTLRVYTTEDILGVQLGGTIKNVMAIAAGIADGLGYGANARAALITRGMAEILKLAQSEGAKTETLFGLSGIGDLILTCTDDQSRNRQLGLAIGGGLTPQQATEQLGKTVEGIHAAAIVLQRAKKQGLEMPIVEQVCKILFEGYEPKQAVQALLQRQQKAESQAIQKN